MQIKSTNQFLGQNIVAAIYSYFKNTFHKGAQVENVVIYLSMFFNISGISDDHFYLFIFFRVY